MRTAFNFNNRRFVIINGRLDQIIHTFGDRRYKTTDTGIGQIIISAGIGKGFIAVFKPKGWPYFRPKKLNYFQKASKFLRELIQNSIGLF